MARHDAGLTQRALATAADIAQASVSRIERDLISPRASTIERWLDACGMTLRIEPVRAVSETPDVREETRPTDETVLVPEGAAEEEDESDGLDWASWI